MLFVKNKDVFCEKKKMNPNFLRENVFHPNRAKGRGLCLSLRRTGICGDYCKEMYQIYNKRLASIHLE